MMPHGGNWGAPSVVAALAGSVHDGESAGNYQRNDDNDSYYGSVHCNLPCWGEGLPIVNARDQAKFGKPLR
jgi:hypothetical protein